MLAVGVGRATAMATMGGGATASRCMGAIFGREMAKGESVERVAVRCSVC